MRQSTAPQQAAGFAMVVAIGELSQQAAGNIPRRDLKTRLLGVLLIVIFAGLIWYNWHQLTNEGRYSLKLAAFGPVGVLGGFFVLLFPGKAGKPETTRDKIIVLLVFGIGVVAGLFNWYLMDPGFFGR
jgi:uncharacterized membrane protein